MTRHRYVMESEEESIRLDVKTDPRTVQKYARWAGIQAGMKLGDFGCGPGKTSYYLNRLVQEGGSTLGIDISPRRIDYARNHFLSPGLEFVIGDIRESLEPYGLFDFIWVRFVLEHYRSSAFEIVRNTSSALKPGGILCLIDLDYNCLSHFGLSPALEHAMTGLMQHLEQWADFDPYAGRKLYSYLFDLEFTEIRIKMAPHHLIYGQAKENDLFNWTKKVEIATRQSGYDFKEYENGFQGFYSEFQTFFHDPRRFTYTPVIACCGRKPRA
jgi:2-polyprenyl-3-methyl-5-hydroxy-6-metoxy-1,4-benzoquinol methylase